MKEKIKIINVVGARPNFMKIAPLHRTFSKHPMIQSKILHTGQHYDAKMSDVFFNQLELPQPDFYLGIGGGSHTYQKAHVMLKFEEILLEESPDIVLVVGDVNATAACSIVAVKMGIKTVHVEAGLRSGDRSMPEEINRMITDVICDHLFVHEQSGMINLAKEGISDEKISFVGNVMIDSLIYYREKAKQEKILDELKVAPKEYILMTMHRPANVDNKESLEDILEIIENAVEHKTVVFPIHPRTSNNIKKFGLEERLGAIKNLALLEPQGYLQFLKLMDNASLIITDSGGIQEETTYLQVPCMTFRDSTERPSTVDLGTNILMKDLNPITVKIQMEKILNGRVKKGIIPPLWDGNTADRIANILVEQFQSKTQIHETFSL
jgi:UDP-N-acetylglucosamine 2-epimerase (non-hydrolysing)